MFLRHIRVSTCKIVQRVGHPSDEGIDGSTLLGRVGIERLVAMLHISSKYQLSSKWVQRKELHPELKTVRESTQ